MSWRSAPLVAGVAAFGAALWFERFSLALILLVVTFVLTFMLRPRIGASDAAGSRAATIEPVPKPAPPPRVVIGKCESCGRDVRVRGGEVRPGAQLTCRCGHVNTFGEKPAKEEPQRKKSRDKLEGLLIVFNGDFEPKDRFISSILSTMEARGRTYQSWLSATTPQKVVILEGDLTPERYLARALVEFRMLGLHDADLRRFEEATFEGSHGISGVVITHWAG